MKSHTKALLIAVLMVGLWAATAAPASATPPYIPLPGAGEFPPNYPGIVEATDPRPFGQAWKCVITQADGGTTVLTCTPLSTFMPPCAGTSIFRWDPIRAIWVREQLMLVCPEWVGPALATSMAESLEHALDDSAGRGSMGNPNNAVAPQIAGRNAGTAPHMTALSPTAVITPDPPLGAAKHYSMPITRGGTVGAKGAAPASPNYRHHTSSPQTCDTDANGVTTCVDESETYDVFGPEQTGRSNLWIRATFWITVPNVNRDRRIRVHFGDGQYADTTVYRGGPHSFSAWVYYGNAYDAALDTANQGPVIQRRGITIEDLDDGSASHLRYFYDAQPVATNNDPPMEDTTH